jgi:hypothetical protein
MIGNPLLLPDEGYNISRSVRLRSSASAYFNRTFASTGNRKTWTWSGWGKLGSLSSGLSFLTQYTDGNNQSQARIRADGVLRFYDLVSGSFTTDIYWSPVYRDPSAWYHLMLVADTTQATNTNRIKFYVNGVQVTSTSSATWPSQNTDLRVNLNAAHFIGQNGANNEYADGYLTEINFIDGQALTPSSFGETDILTGVWKPKKYTGTYGTNGFFLNFSDPSAASASAIGKDYSGNGNNWTPNNISVTSGSTYDSMLDVPTLWADGGNGRGNYAVLNPLRYSTNGSLSEANLKYSNGSGDNGAKAISTIGIPSGKWYFEGQWVSGPSNSRFIIGFASSTTAVTNASLPFERDGSQLSLTSSDIANVAIDFDAGKIWYGKNNVWISSGDPATGANPFQTFTPSSYDFLYPALRLYGSSDGTTVGVINFGQRPFAYTPPTGFKALNTQNLPEPLIKKGNQWFDVSLWNGTQVNQSITNSGFQPDFIWNKSRSNAGLQHILTDSVRGVNAQLFSALTNAEETRTDRILSFNSNGFTVGTYTDVNQSGQTFVAWQWKEGATPGFDIVTYTGTGANRTVAHNLGVTPAMMIVKRRDSGPSSWTVWHSSFSSLEYIYLNLTNAKSSSSGSTVWNSTLPTSSVFSLGTYTDVNASGGNYVAYLFAEVAGFSKFGSYTGNGSTDGPMIFTGFRPRWVMIKRTDTAETWTVVDSSRTTINKNSVEFLQPNSSAAEFTDTNSEYDFLANGFKLKDAGSLVNASGGTYVYAAFAEFPFKTALAR